MTKAEAIEKIRKLRRLAGDAGATRPEAESAGRLAGELVALHGITAAELEGPATAAGVPDFDFGFGGVSWSRGGIRVTVGGANFEGPLDDFLSFLYRAAQAAPSSAPAPGKGHRPKRVTVDAISDHAKHPSRVHLAVNNMRSVCGIGPTFVWSFERAVAIRSGEPCPHCMETGVIDAREPQLKLPASRLRDARGRWI
jgi:hypothetical protein